MAKLGQVLKSPLSGGVVGLRHDDSGENLQRIQRKRKARALQELSLSTAAARQRALMLRRGRISPEHHTSFHVSHIPTLFQSCSVSEGHI